MMYGREKSDSAIVAKKPANKVGMPAAEWAEPRAETEGNARQQRTRRAQNRESVSLKLERVRQAGKQRPLGVTALEDKIVQRAIVAILNAVYEADFLGFSYGFRPGRSQHDALDALATGVTTTPVNWILDADIQGFFDAVSQAWLVR